MKSPKIYRTLLFTVVLLLQVNFSFVCSQPKTLTILHTNDMHAAFEPHEAGWIQSDPKPMVGGFEELWWTVDSIRKAKGTTLLLDAGDVMTGTPISDIEYKGSLGGALFEMMNTVGYDAWTIGNHDLDISQDNLNKLIHIAKFPTVSANLLDTLGNFPFSNKEYIILKKGDVRIGVIGLMLKGLFRETKTSNLQGLKVIPPQEIAQHIIDKISPDVDVLIALTHEGVDEDSMLAVSTHGLNIIIGGHSHTRLKTPKFVNEVIICQTGSSCENLGELDVTIENHHVTKYNGKLIQLWARTDRPKTEMSAMVEHYKTEVDKEFGEVVGTLVSDWKRSGRGETNIGDFVADALREGADAQMAVTNSSGIRKELHTGNIRKLDLYEISPFHNYLSTFKFSGKELKEFAQRYAQLLADGKSSIQISGLQCKWKRVNGKAEVISLTIGGNEIAEDKLYICATSDFVINQADRYLGMTPSSVTTLDSTIFQALLAKVQRDKSVNSQIEHRFEEIK